MAAADALHKGGVPVDDSYYWPGNLGDDLANLSKQASEPDQSWSIAPVPFGVELQVELVSFFLLY
jgi:hypothetical protein